MFLGLFLVERHRERMEIPVKTMMEIRAQLASLVATKVEATRKRRACRKERAPSLERGAELQSLWGDCRSAKQDVRYAQLAYALVRGRAYWTQERRCAVGRAASAYLLGLAAGCTTEEAKAWLGAEVDAAARAAFDAHEAAARETWRARRAARAMERRRVA